MPKLKTNRGAAKRFKKTASGGFKRGHAYHQSALCDYCPENIGVVPVVVAELGLANIERHVFGADFVEGADNASLEDDQKPSIVFM
jgi:hypothetical protein